MAQRIADTSGNVKLSIGPRLLNSRPARFNEPFDPIDIRSGRTTYEQDDLGRSSLSAVDWKSSYWRYKYFVMGKFTAEHGSLVLLDGNDCIGCSQHLRFFGQRQRRH